MSNINDYLKWRGDISLSYSSFNEVDELILARFSYLPFKKINLEEVETIEDISKKMANFKEEDFAYHGDKELTSLLGKSERFKDFKVTDFVENTDVETEKQFSAITVHLNDKIMYVSFDGTDNSIVGWKEDFNMSFLENIPSQIAGKNYLETIANKYKTKKIYVGGHSKGGNVSVYAAIANNKDVQDRIIKIINCDGPGFDEKVINSQGYKNIIDKVVTYIPQDSVIGRVLEHEEKYKIVKSIEKGIYQHDIYSWQVMRTNIEKYANVTDTSEFINKTLKNYLKETTPEQRKIFVGIVYEIISSTNAKTFKEFSKIWFSKLPTILKSYKSLNEEDKKILTNMAGEFFRSALKTMRTDREERKMIENESENNVKTIDTTIID